MKKNITLTLIKEDFIGADYTNNEDCPIARCLKRITNYKDILVSGFHVTFKEPTIFFYKICPVYEIENPFQVSEDIPAHIINEKNLNSDFKYIVKLTKV